jgi:hypothetical protein
MRGAIPPLHSNNFTFTSYQWYILKFLTFLKIPGLVSTIFKPPEVQKHTRLKVQNTWFTDTFISERKLNSEGKNKTLIKFDSWDEQRNTLEWTTKERKTKRIKTETVLVKISK